MLLVEERTQISMPRRGCLISAWEEARCNRAPGAWPLGGPRLSLAVTLSVNHAPVEDPGHHAALLVVQLQRDSLEDRKIRDCWPEGRAPALPATSAPLGMGIACRSRAGGSIQHPLLVAELPPHSAHQHSSACPSTPLDATGLWGPHHGLLCHLLELHQAYLPHLAAVAVGGTAQSGRAVGVNVLGHGIRGLGDGLSGQNTDRGLGAPPVWG